MDFLSYEHLVFVGCREEKLRGRLSAQSGLWNNCHPFNNRSNKMNIDVSITYFVHNTKPKFEIKI